MTTQWIDVYLYNNTPWELVSRSGPKCFDPASYGLWPLEHITTACRRGYLCWFHLNDQSLQLDNLLIKIRRQKNDKKHIPINTYPPLNGINPVPHKRHRQAAFYRHLNLSLDFTGDLLIGTDPVAHVSDLVHLFIPKGIVANRTATWISQQRYPWCYEYLLEVTIHGGKIKKIIDHSQAMLELRQGIDEKTRYARDIEDLLDTLKMQAERCFHTGFCRPH